MAEARPTIPLSTLLWKEWRQLRLIRIVGAGLCLMIPPLLLTALAAARRGMLPFDITSSYTVREIVLDAVPTVLIGAWALLTLFVVAQSLLGDRAAGVEAFLLSSPVRRRWVFGARLCAALGSALTIATAGLLVWMTWALTSAGWEGLSESRALAVLVGGGAIAILIGVASGTGAAALVPLPMPAVLTGLVFGVAPLGLAAFLGATFPFARLGPVPLGTLLPLLLFPAFGVASFRALCTGEPAGRGRYRRAAVVLGIALAVVGVLFVSIAPFAVERGSYRYGAVDGSPAQALAFLRSGNAFDAGWLVDTSTGDPLQTFGPAVGSSSWSPDGRYLAVASDGGPLGMRLPTSRIEIYDTTSRAILHTLSAGDLGLASTAELIWTATHLVVAGWDQDWRQWLGAIRLADWRARTVPVDPAFLGASQWALIGPGSDDRLLLAIAPRDPEGHSPLRLHVFDIEQGTVAAQPLLEQQGFDPRQGFSLSWKLSPTGRYWVESEQGAAGNLRLRNLDTLEATEIECTWVGRLTWLAGDTAVWADDEKDRSRLRAWDPLGGARDLSVADAGSRFYFGPSPDRNKLLVMERARLGMHPNDFASPGSTRVLDLRSGQWSLVPKSEGRPLLFHRRGNGWGGPDVLALWSEEGIVYQRLQVDPSR